MNGELREYLETAAAASTALGLAARLDPMVALRQD
jgi:hypothetical protein